MRLSAALRPRAARWLQKKKLKRTGLVGCGLGELQHVRSHVFRLSGHLLHRELVQGTSDETAVL